MGAYSRGGGYFTFWPIRGARIKEGAFIRGCTIVEATG